MRIETDLKRIKRLAKKRAEENWDFRSYLKQIDMGTKELDAVVHRIVTQVTSKIDCPKCANCCQKMNPVLDEDDIVEFCVGLKIATSKFREEYLIQADNPSKYVFKGQPCPFLSGKLCSNYEHRPKDCRSYPHLHKTGFTSRLWRVVDNYSICPIVFNTYEWLKAELWNDDDWDEGD
jgi:Fe-S-cluster containining protein